MYLRGMSPNGLPSFCNLHKCIECNKVDAGLKFAKYASHTRQKSEPLSSIAKKCSEIVNLIQNNSCEFAAAGSQADLSPVSIARSLNHIEIPGLNVVVMILLSLL